MSKTEDSKSIINIIHGFSLDIEDASIQKFIDLYIAAIVETDSDREPCFNNQIQFIRYCETIQDVKFVDYDEEICIALEDKINLYREIPIILPGQVFGVSVPFTTKIDDLVSYLAYVVKNIYFQEMHKKLAFKSIREVLNYPSGEIACTGEKIKHTNEAHNFLFGVGEKICREQKTFKENQIYYPPLRQIDLKYFLGMLSSVALNEYSEIRMKNFGKHLKRMCLFLTQVENYPCGVFAVEPIAYLKEIMQSCPSPDWSVQEKKIIDPMFAKLAEIREEMYEKMKYTYAAFKSPLNLLLDKLELLYHIIRGCRHILPQENKFKMDSGFGTDIGRIMYSLCIPHMTYGKIITLYDIYRDFRPYNDEESTNRFAKLLTKKVVITDRIFRLDRKIKPFSNMLRAYAKELINKHQNDREKISELGRLVYSVYFCLMKEFVQGILHEFSPAYAQHFSSLNVDTYKDEQIAEYEDIATELGRIMLEGGRPTLPKIANTVFMYFLMTFNTSRYNVYLRNLSVGEMLEIKLVDVVDIYNSSN